MTVMLALAVASVASAQEGFNAHGFELAALEPDARDPLTLRRPDGLAQGGWYAGGLLEYASESLVYRTTNPLGDDLSTQAALDDLVVLNSSVGWALHERLRADLVLPLVLTSQGLDGGQGVGVADGRLAMRVLALDPANANGIGLGLNPYLDLPLGRRQDFLGQGAFAGGFDVAGTAELSRFTATAELGVYAGPTRELAGLVVDDAFTTGLAFGWLPLDDLGFTVETQLDVPLRKSEVRGVGAPSEVLLSGRRILASGGHALGGLAFATTKGASAAEWRLFVGGGFGQGDEGSEPKDTDLDGIVDREDACVDAPETFNGVDDADGCPDVLPKLRVLVTREGALVGGAELTVEAAGGERSVLTTTVGPTELEARPDSTWRASAKLGCLAGEGMITTPLTGDAMLEIALTVAFDAELRVDVVGSNDAPIPDATVKVSPVDPACEGTTDASGQQMMPIAAGEHTIEVVAPGFPPVVQRVVVASGESKVARVQIVPTRVRIVEKQIVLDEAVHFDTGKTVILPISFSILDDVTRLILDNPQIGRVEVAGHTDAQGAASTNFTLSQRRAEAVRTYLIEAGVPSRRLAAHGYGEELPIDSNATATGRARNRRVAFNLD